MKLTALTATHTALGAKMVEFAGYNMPVLYTGINEEHAVVRNSVGMFDVSHMGEFMVTGPGSLELIQSVTTNDASKLTPGRAQYSCLPNGNGGIVDDLLVYMMDTDKYLLVVNAGNIDKDWNWITSHNKAGVKMENISDRTSLLAVQGPKALMTLQKLTDVNLSTIPYYHFAVGKFDGLDNVIISNTGYTGAGGFELYFPNEHAQQIWDAILLAGEQYAIKPIGLGARDTLRLEKAFCLYGNDIDDTTSPLEAGLGWITKLDKGTFTDSDKMAKMKTEGVSRKLVGFEMVDRGIPRHDYEIADKDGNTIGKVTSGTQSPTLQRPIGLGYVKTAFAPVGSEIYIKIRDKSLKAVVVKTPFL
jgi:aminomethyltransferase